MCGGLVSWRAAAFDQAWEAVYFASEVDDGAVLERDWSWVRTDASALVH